MSDGDERLETRLLAEYNANISLWQHDDLLRQSRNNTFLNVNTILLVAQATFLGIGFDLPLKLLISVFLSIFGFTVCAVWRSVLFRNAEYIRFHRLQLRHIEQQLEGMTAFTNIYDAFYRHRTISVGNLDDTFTINKSARVSSTMMEGRVPLILSAVWVLVFTSSAVGFFLTLVL